MNVRVFFFLVFLPLAAHAQGFAGLGAVPEDGFALPEKGRVLEFPADHGAHPDFRIEWWYVTANLESADGTPYGIQWTLFRAAISPQRKSGTESSQIWMGHAGLTTTDRHFVAETLARDGIGQAGVELNPFSAWIDNWEMTSVADGLSDPLSRLNLSASGSDFGYALRMEANGPLVLQGQDGFSVKSESGQASHYYSQPFYEVSGELFLPEGPVQVTGQAWLDREWSSQHLNENQTGWDWFSLHLDGGEKLMVYRLRSDGPEGDYLFGTLISSDGAPNPTVADAMTLEHGPLVRVGGGTVPVEWRITAPDINLDLSIRALNPQSWMSTRIPYWEGPVSFEGSHKGRGYLEMTGYE